MNIEALTAIESETGAKFSINDSGNLVATGETDASIDAATKQIGDMDIVAFLCRQRQRLPEKSLTTITRELAIGVLSLASQRVTYVNWTLARSGYYQRTDEELDRMFAVLEEGDLVVPDFALSFSVRRRNGSVVQVDRRGRVLPPSPYSPALKG